MFTVWRPGGFDYACSKKVSISLLFLSTEFLGFNIEDDSIDKGLYLVSDIRLILKGAWPCHVPNF